MVSLLLRVCCADMLGILSGFLPSMPTVTTQMTCVDSKVKATPSPFSRLVCCIETQLVCLLLQVSIVDVTAQTKMFSLAGPKSTGVLEELGATAPASKQIILMGFQNSPVVVAAGSGLSCPGYTLIADELAAGELWRSLTVKASIRLVTLLTCYSVRAELQCCMTDHVLDLSVSFSMLGVAKS